jgi:Tfp pilus assembly protein FimT
MLQHQSTKGISLPEILVVVAGLLLLMAVTVKPLFQTIEYYRLETATQQLAAAMELARHSAIARNEDVVAALDVDEGAYEVFIDSNFNEARDPSEIILTQQHLPVGVLFDGSGLWGPPSSPSEPVSEPVSFSSHRVVFNPQGKLAGGTGAIYLQNRAADARAISFNIAGRMKIYTWQKKSTTWK